MPLVKLSSKAQKGYEKFPEYRDEFNRVLDPLETNPYPFHDFDLQKLKGFKNAYRIRIGKMRVKHHILEQGAAILVYYMGPREGACD